jgi:hypothetical protein
VLWVKRTLLWTLLVMLASAAGYLGYHAYLTYLEYRAAAAKDAEREAWFVDNRSRLVDALRAAEVGPDELLRGFWYSYRDAAGGESVGRFDLDGLAWREPLSDEYIADLAARVKDAHRVPPTSMRELADSELSPELRFHNTLYNLQPRGAYIGTLDALRAAYGANTASAEDLWRLAYMLEMQGDYGERDGVYEALCERYGERCGSGTVVTLRGRVVDLEGRPIQGATVKLLSRPDFGTVTTDKSGAFTLRAEARQMEKIRVSAVKRNYSSGVASAVNVTGGRKVIDMGHIALGAPIDIITIDTLNRTVTDPRSEARADGSFVVRGQYSAYEIPPDVVVDGSGRPYRGVVDVYVYEFTRDTVPQNLVTLDTFDEVIGYAGNLMLSYGMPFIQFFTESGEQLDVRADKPMTLTYACPACPICSPTSTSCREVP